MILFVEVDLKIEQAEVIRKILEHLGMWGARRKPVPRANAPPMLRIAENVEGYFPTVDDQMVDPKKDRMAN